MSEWVYKLDCLPQHLGIAKYGDGWVCLRRTGMNTFEKEPRWSGATPKEAIDKALEETKEIGTVGENL